MRTVCFTLVYDGQVFYLNGLECIRIPTMRLKTPTCAFICNHIRINPSDGEYMADTHTVDFIHEQCEVQIPN